MDPIDPFFHQERHPRLLLASLWLCFVRAVDGSVVSVLAAPPLVWFARASMCSPLMENGG